MLLHFPGIFWPLYSDLHYSVNFTLKGDEEYNSAQQFCLSVVLKHLLKTVSPMHLDIV